MSEAPIENQAPAEEAKTVEQKVEPTPPAITYTREGMEVTLTLTFGLLNTLLKRLGNIENVQFVGVEGTVNEVVLLEMLQTRDARGKVIGTRLQDISDVSVTVEDMEALLEFAREHLLDFSVRTTERASAQLAKRGPQLKRLAELTAGLTGLSASKTKT